MHPIFRGKIRMGTRFLWPTLKASEIRQNNGFGVGIAYSF